MRGTFSPAVPQTIQPLIDEQDQFAPDNWSYSIWKYSTGRIDEEMMKERMFMMLRIPKRDSENLVGFEGTLHL
jgi:hypothetical protein